MSFSGRLGSSSTSNIDNVVPISFANNVDNVIPISMSSTSSWDVLWPQETTSKSVENVNVIRRHRPASNHHHHQGLADELIRCRAQLKSQETTIATLRTFHEKTLASIFRNLLELEVGLRKKEKELSTALLQREKVIREQNFLIKVLTKKAGAKRADIRQICDEAKAKIPQVEATSLTASAQDGNVKNVENRKMAFPSNVELSSIVESCDSENDSDSAIMLDDERILLQQSSPEMSSTTSAPRTRRLNRSRTISRSVSDVASATLSEEFQVRQDDDDDGHEADVVDRANLSHAFSTPHICANNEKTFDVVDVNDENDFNGFDSAHYRGFLLRHGSYERYKIRAKTKILHPDISGVCTLPRTKTNDKTGIHFHVGSSDALQQHRRRVPTAQPMTSSPKPASSSSSTLFETKTCGKNSTTVVMINTDQESFYPGRARANTNHRRITKPRDVKNRSNIHKNQKLKNVDHSSNTNNENNNIVKKSGSVYCSSIFLSSDESYSFA